MTAVDRRFGRPPRPPADPARDLYQAARRDANLAFVNWLRTGPDAADVGDEVDADHAVLRQLVALAASDAQ